MSAAGAIAAAAPLIDAALAEGLGSAVALGVVRSDGARAALARGSTRRWRRDAEGLQPWPGVAVSVETAFDLASLTKPMCTTTLCAIAVAEGRLSLAQRLDSALPEAAGTGLGAATIAALLGHGAGALAWHDFAADAAELPAEARPAAVRQAVLHRTLERAPGEAAVYSDLGFMALGWALEAVFDAPLDALFARHIAGPLGLRAARFRRRVAGSSEAVVATEIWPPRCADGAPLQGQVHDDNCAALDGVAGHAGLFAGVDEVLTWARAWLCAVRGVAGPLAEALGPAAAWPTIAAAPDTTWRLGFDTPSGAASTAGATAGPRAFGHLGFTGTSVWCDPDRDAAVVLLTNRVHPSRDAVAGIRALRPRIHEAIWAALGAPEPAPAPD